MARFHSPERSCTSNIHTPPDTVNARHDRVQHRRLAAARCDGRPRRADIDGRPRAEGRSRRHAAERPRALGPGGEPGRQALGAACGRHQGAQEGRAPPHRRGHPAQERHVPLPKQAEPALKGEMIHHLDYPAGSEIDKKFGFGTFFQCFCSDLPGQ